MRIGSAAIAFWLIASGAVALARAPQPAKPVSIGMFSGRWYEIARVAEGKKAQCQFGTSDFSGRAGAAFAVVETCHEGSPDGPAHEVKATVRIVPGAGNAKIRMGFFGGLVTQEYWILDHADDDQSWALMATPGGHYLWLLSRSPALKASAKSAAVARIAALGYDASHLQPSR